MLFLLVLSLASFFPGTDTRGLIVLGSIVLTLVLLALAAGIAPHTLLRGSLPLLFIVLGVFFFQAVEFSPAGINLDGLKEALVFCVRIGAAFSAGALLFAVTTPAEIRKSLNRAEAALRLEKLKLGLYLSLMLGFMPRFFEVWETLKLAWENRAGKKKLSRLTSLIPLLIERMMSHAAETALAMDSRGGSLGALNDRTHLRYDGK